MSDAIIISDLHLGSDVCQSKQLLHFIERVKTHLLILNGDVFNSMDMRRLRKSHWRILSTLRKLSNKMHIVYIAGNHDGPAEIISNLLGLEVADHFVFTSGGKEILVLHGHIFDDFIEAHPWVTRFGDMAYWMLQKIDKSHRIARFAKKKSKTYLNCADKIERRAKIYCKEHNFDIVCVGHTHMAAQKTSSYPYYFNSGCWTEKPCTYLEVNNGEVEVKTYIDTEKEV